MRWGAEALWLRVASSLLFQPLLRVWKLKNYSLRLKFNCIYTNFSRKGRLTEFTSQILIQCKGEKGVYKLLWEELRKTESSFMRCICWYGVEQKRSDNRSLRDNSGCSNRIKLVRNFTYIKFCVYDVYETPQNYDEIKNIPWVTEVVLEFNESTISQGKHWAKSRIINNLLQSEMVMQPNWKTKVEPKIIHRTQTKIPAFPAFVTKTVLCHCIGFCEPSEASNLIC